MNQIDANFAQLALARGHATLGQILSAVSKSSTTGRELPDVLILEGLLTNGEAAELLRDAEQDDTPEIEKELQYGNTIVVGEILRNRGDVLETIDEIPILSGNSEVELEPGERYTVGRELGRGGMGEVFEAKDNVLKRHVALKRLNSNSKSEKDQHRLLVEAQLTGLLEHPSIVPVYDLRTNDIGEPYYTMRVVQERSLGQILKEIRLGTETEYSLINLVSVLRQVSLAVQFAHHKGVVHRDLKPENILVGEYGEVYVIDWGIAKIIKNDLGLETTAKHQAALVGTPQYMAPEQARGDSDALDGRADVYALGAILYEILTLTPMFSSDHILGLLFMVVHDPVDPPSERAPDRNVPTELEEICLRAVAKSADARFRTAEDFADELESFLEGEKRAQRQLELAADAVMQAEQIRAVYDEVRMTRKQVRQQLEDERRRIDKWSPSEAKEPIWDLEQQEVDLGIELEKQFGETIRAYSEALLYQPDSTPAREAMGELYWERFAESERDGDLSRAAFFEGLVRQFNDGKYDRLLAGDAHVSIASSAPAEVTLWRFQTVSRRLVQWKVADLGTTPLAAVAIPHGSYVLSVSADGFRTINKPILLGRGATMSTDVTLYKENEIPADFVVVPSGEFLFGNPVTSEFVDDFAIAKTPITCQQYLEFVNSLAKTDPKAAAARVPKDNQTLYFTLRDDGSYSLPDEDPDGDAWRPDWPIFMVSYYDAEAYANWLGEKLGKPIRLPSLLEWEKAARGTDGRIYAWGQHFDPSFCRMRTSVRGRALPSAVGKYELDRSPYGILDVCGNIAEWTTTSEPENPDANFLGGASYNSFAEMCRLDFNMSSPKSYNFAHYGFRLAMSL